MTLPRNELVALILRGREIARQRAQERFIKTEARVSGVGLCQRKQVARALGQIPDSIPEVYQRAGYVAELMLAAELRLVEPDLLEQVEVPTITGGRSHPDFFLRRLRWAIQQKAPSDAATRSKTIKSHNRDQVLLEWQSWRRAGYCVTRDGERIDSVPTRYFLVLTGRESYGVELAQNEVRWDGARAERLEARLAHTQMLIDAGYLPERELEKPSFECWDWKTRAARCPLAFECWGRAWGVREAEQPTTSDYDDTCETEMEAQA